MTERPPLTLAGGAVELIARLPDGRAVAVYLDRDRNRTPFSQPAHCFELRGIGWHLAEIKRLIAGLPLQGAAPVAPTQPSPQAATLPLPDPTLIEPRALRPRGFLHAHYAADRED
ncbi:hypothetical protein [Reyranella sp.]|uniref:hypothetical protein n=1 Tax=Reyranella sp. TaxID=1929291 RepID=UPI003F70B2D7